jgi:hypothetical protein
LHHYVDFSLYILCQSVSFSCLVSVWFLSDSLFPLLCFYLYLDTMGLVRCLGSLQFGCVTAHLTILTADVSVVLYVMQACLVLGLSLSTRVTPFFPPPLPFPSSPCSRYVIDMLSSCLPFCMLVWGRRTGLFDSRACLSRVGTPFALINSFLYGINPISRRLTHSLTPSLTHSLTHSFPCSFKVSGGMVKCSSW